MAAIQYTGSTAPDNNVNDLPPNMKPEYVQMADSASWYSDREMWDDAKRCTLQALRCDPANFGNAMLLSNLGIYEINLGNPVKAIEDFSLGLNLTPRSSTLLANRAKAYLLTGNSEAAEADLEKILEYTPDHSWALKMLGTIKAMRSDEEQAFAILSKIPDPDADTLRILASIAWKKGDSERALELFDCLIKTAPTDESYADRALFLIDCDRLSEAADDIREGLKLNQRNGNLYLIRAFLHRILHENSLAEIDKKMAREYKADNDLFTRLFPNDKRKR